MDKGFLTLFTVKLKLIFFIYSEIKRCLFLGRKVIINLDSILKSRDITSPTKVHLVKAMVFPVVIYGDDTTLMEESEEELKNLLMK